MGVKILNLDKCLKKLGYMGQIDVKKPVSEGALKIVIRARDLVPVRTGQLMHSIWYEPKDGDFRNGAVVFASAEYASAVEFGVDEPVTIYPTEKKALYWKGAKHPVKKVVIPPRQPKPYLYPAFVQTRSAVREHIKRGIKAELDKLKV